MGVCTKRGADRSVSEKLDLEIGSTHEVSPAQIAQLVAKIGGSLGVKIRNADFTVLRFFSETA